jgi:hypothetical protein
MVRAWLLFQISASLVLLLWREMAKLWIALVIFAHVEREVFGLTTQDFEIRRGVVSPIPVNVMDNLIWCERSSEHFFYYEEVFTDIAVGLCARMFRHVDKAISVINANVAAITLICVAALLRAKVTFCVSLGSKRLAAVMANSSILRGHQKLILSGVKPWDVRSVARAIRVFDWSHYTTPALEVRG